MAVDCFVAWASAPVAAWALVPVAAGVKAACAEAAVVYGAFAETEACSLAGAGYEQDTALRENAKVFAA